MAELIRNDDTVQVTVPSGTWNTGDLQQTSDGRLGIVVGRPASAGESATLQTRGEVEVANSGVALTAGNQVGIDISAQNAVAAGGGDLNGGRVLETVTTSQAVRFLLNEA